MTGEVVEGTAVEVVPEVRAVAVVQQPGQSLVAAPDGPAGMVEVASRLATVLRDIVERQHLFAVISGRKYPQVEAWMTIARLDNVVAREPHGQPPVRRDDGSYEAFAEIVRLSDGMVIGASSALCGTPDDMPWAKRPEPARRSMAQTRATSRAFRQQYSWIMALAGYEPTPAEEMPRDEPQGGRTEADGSLMGTVEVGDRQTSDYALRQTPDGLSLGFRLRGDRGGILVRCSGPLAEQLAAFREAVVGQRVTCWGRVGEESFTPRGSDRKVTYQVLLQEAEELIEGRKP